MLRGTEYWRRSLNKVCIPQRNTVYVQLEYICALTSLWRWDQILNISWAALILFNVMWNSFWYIHPWNVWMGLKEIWYMCLVRKIKYSITNVCVVPKSKINVLYIYRGYFYYDFNNVNNLQVYCSEMYSCYYFIWNIFNAL